MISCNFCCRFAVCMQKLYNHSTIGKNFPPFMKKLLLTCRNRGYFTDFDRKFLKTMLWKNLWKV